MSLMDLYRVHTLELAKNIANINEFQKVSLLRPTILSCLKLMKLQKS